MSEKKFEDAYGCVKCQIYHYKSEPVYLSHLTHQSKHGIQKREVFSPKETECFYNRIDKSAIEPVEVNEDEFYEALEVVPPVYAEACFGMGETASHNSFNQPVYYFFAKIKDRFFGTKATKETAEIRFRTLRNNIARGAIR